MGLGERVCDRQTFATFWFFSFLGCVCVCVCISFDLVLGIYHTGHSCDCWAREGGIRGEEEEPKGRGTRGERREHTSLIQHIRSLSLSPSRSASLHRLLIFLPLPLACVCVFNIGDENYVGANLLKTLYYKFVAKRMQYICTLHIMDIRMVGKNMDTNDIVIDWVGRGTCARASLRTCH